MKSGLKKIAFGIIAVLVLAAITYFLGPKPQSFNAPNLSDTHLPAWFTDASQIGEYLEKKDDGKKIRAGNYSQVIWADSVGKKTKYVMLYLHGFSASPEEGKPIHQGVALRYGMNMYAPRLAEMGLDENEPMLNFTAEKFMASAAEALKVAHLLGDTVILMSTSTGCTAALFLAAQKKGIHSLICYSPNIQVFDHRASLLTKPWGLQIARKVKGSDYNVWEAPAGAEKYWHLKYRLEATVELQRLIDGTMKPEVFSGINIPTFMGYYYKDEAHQDDVVSVDAMLNMFDKLGSPIKKKVAFPNAGAHCIPNQYFSKDVENVFAQTCVFIEKELGLKPRS